MSEPTSRWFTLTLCTFFDVSCLVTFLFGGEIGFIQVLGVTAIAVFFWPQCNACALVPWWCLCHIANFKKSSCRKPNGALSLLTKRKKIENQNGKQRTVLCIWTHPWWCLYCERFDDRSRPVVRGTIGLRTAVDCGRLPFRFSQSKNIVPSISLCNSHWNEIENRCWCVEMLHAGTLYCVNIAPFSWKCHSRRKFSTSDSLRGYSRVESMPSSLLSLFVYSSSTRLTLPVRI